MVAIALQHLKIQAKIITLSGEFQSHDPSLS